MTSTRALVSSYLWTRRSLLLVAFVLALGLGALGATRAFGTGNHGTPAHAAQAGSGPKQDTRLMLTQSQWAKDESAPTMDQMFPPDGFAMHVPILVWWLVLELLGLIAFPFCFLFLSNLADRGFIIAKTMGILLVGYLIWITASLGILTFDRLWLWVIVIALAVAAGLTAYAQREQLVLFFRERWRTVLWGEAVFLAGFVIFLLLRMWYPDLGHQFSPVSPKDLGGGRMGEKQMELAFLNAIVRSRVFPPFDPFFAHGYINYYYYGFVLVGTLCKLTQIVPATGFNLAIATFFGLLMGNVFSVVNSLVRRVTPALMAGLFVGLIGNLNGAWQLITDLMGVSGLHSSFPLFGGLVDAAGGLYQVLVNHQAMPAFDFWAPTRIIPPPGGPINEFPYFTYLFADLHPHLMAFPITVAAIAFAVHLALDRGMSGGRAALTAVLGAILLGAIVVTNPWDFPTYLAVVGLGALAGAYASRRHLHWRLLLRPLFWGGAVALLSVLLYLPFQRGYQTVFTTGLGLVRDISPASLQGLCNNNPQPCNDVIHDAIATPLHIYLEHFGLFVFLVLSYLAVLLGLDAGLWGAARRWFTRAQFAYYYRDQLPRVRRAAAVAARLRPARHAPEIDLSVSVLTGLIVLVVGLLLFNYILLAFLMGVAGIVVLLLLRLGRALNREQLFLLGLILVPVLITAGTQIFYVKDFLDGGTYFRMNTIFKFYNQAWVLYAITAAIGLYHVVTRLTPERPVRVSPAEEPPAAVPVTAGRDFEPEEAGALPLSSSIDLAAEEGSLALSDPGIWRVQEFTRRHGLWSAAFLLLLAGSLVYTYAGTVARETYRELWLPENSVPFTLDGMAFMKVAYPGDYAGISWLNAHARGVSVVAEAWTPNGYTWPSRVAMFTGLPDIFNGIHEQEQRWGDELDPSGLCQTSADPATCAAQTHSRSDDLATLYNSTSTAEAWRVIGLYGVTYIYVGISERQIYSANGLAKFDAMTGNGLRIAFRAPGTTIYEVTRRV